MYEHYLIAQTVGPGMNLPHNFSIPHASGRSDREIGLIPKQIQETFGLSLTALPRDNLFHRGLQRFSDMNSAHSSYF